MDIIDQQLVHLLAQNGRMTHEELARVVPLSRPSVHERVKRLEAHSVIRGYHARIDWSTLGQPLTAFIWVTNREKSDDTATALLHLNCPAAVIEECYGMTGEWCLSPNGLGPQPVKQKGRRDYDPYQPNEFGLPGH